MYSHEIKALIDGRIIYGFLSGEGEPTVVLDAGLGGTSADWASVQPAVASFTQVFSYDRAGMGKSEKALIPRTCTDIVFDLKNLLSTANLQPPYILVAHSWSGINARWYANQYPDEIAGMVLVDPVHEDKYARFEKVLPEERANRMWAFVRDPSKNDEYIDRMASIAQVQSSARLYNFPLIILTRATDNDEMNIIETSLQVEFLKLSTVSWQYFSQFDDHYIQNSEPQLVINSIQQVVELARRNSD